MTRQRFTVPGKLMGLNEYTRLNRTGGALGNKAKQVEQDAVCWAIKAARLRPVKRPVRIRYRWIEPDRKRDKDNIAFAQKFVQDALVVAGILPDDGWEWVVGFDHDFSVDKWSPRIEIEIYEV